MKRSYILLMAGMFACFCSEAFGQSSIRARIKSDGIMAGRPTDIIVTGGNRTTLLYKLQQQEVDNRQLPFAQVKALHFTTPQEFIQANTSYQNARYQEARAKFDEVKGKYKFTEALPGNYSSLAAVMETECAVRMLDWPAVKTLVAQLPRQNNIYTDASILDDVEVYGLLGRLADKKFDEVISAGNALLANQNRWNLKQLSRIRYAIGMAQADKGEQEPALFSLAYAIAGQHGGGLELGASAIIKSMDLLAADPQVADYTRHADKELSVKERAAAPVKVQEIAGLAYLYKNILFPSRKLDDKYEGYLRFYVTPVERRALETEQANQPQENQASGEESKDKAAESAPAGDTGKEGETAQ